MWQWIGEWFVWFKARILEALAGQSSALAELKRGQALILESISQLKGEVMSHFDELIEEVTATRGAVDSAVVLLGKLHDELTEHIDEPAVLATILADMKLQREALAAAVEANSLPEPTPAPEPNL